MTAVWNIKWLGVTVGNMALLLNFFLLVLPLQTVLILRTVFMGGDKWEQATVAIFVTETIIFLAGFYHWYKNKFKIDFKLVVLLVYFLLMVLHAADSWLALQTITHILGAYVVYILLRADYVHQEQIIFYVAIGGVLPTTLGIAQFFAQTAWGSTLLGMSEHNGWVAGASVVVTSVGRWLRAYGTFPHPNILGGFMALVLAQILFWLQKNNLTINKKTGYFYVAIVIICTAALVLSFSRAAWVAWGIVIVWAHGEIFRRPIYSHSVFSLSVFVSALTFFMLLGVVWPIAGTRLTLGSTNEIQSVTERSTGYSDAWDFFKQNSVLGVGPGNFTVALHEKHPELPAWQLQPVHNVLVLFLVEWGIVGLILVLVLSRPFWTWGMVPWLVLSLSDHFLYTTWFGLALTALHISTFYPQRRSVEPKN